MRLALGVLVLTAGLAAGADVADWPQWRGPLRDGLVSALKPRASWPETLAPGWKLKVGTGHSSPVVSGGRVYQFSREAESEVVRAIDLASGRELWRQSYPAPYEMNPAATGHGKGPKSTPVVADGRLYTFGISGTFSAWDAASGRLLWRKTFERSHKSTSPEFGVAMSPAVSRGRVIVHVGGSNDGALMALDAASGATAWEWKGDGPGYASPLVATFDGVEQVVTQTQNALVGVAAADGALVWKEPLRTPYEQNSVTPLVASGLVVYSGLDAPLRAVRPVKKGEAFTLASVWSNPDVGCYMSTPVLYDGRIYGLSHKKKGQWFAVDAASGRTLWLGEGRAGENAAVLAGAGALFLLDTSGALTVAAADATAFRPLRKWTVASSATWAHPVVMDDAILVKDVETLALLRIR
ncbi:MAG TPA: PQQ-binding-like beta-propeller repeat protein [Vicinamibacteria bacterium]